MKSIGEQIHKARALRGMTQADLARVMNVTRAAVSHWETGRSLPDGQTLLELTRVLGWDFTADGPAPSAGGAEPAAEPASGMEAPPAEEKASSQELQAEETDPRPEGGISAARRRTLIVAALAVLLSCFALWMALRPGRATLPEAYRANVTDISKQSHLEIETRAWVESSDRNSYDRYCFTLRETGGIPRRIERFEICLLSGNGTMRESILEPEDLAAAGLSVELAALGELSIDGGFPQGEFMQAGGAFTVRDENGVESRLVAVIDF